MDSKDHEMPIKADAAIILKTKYLFFHMAFTCFPLIFYLFSLFVLGLFFTSINESGNINELIMARINACYSKFSAYFPKNKVPRIAPAANPNKFM